MQAFVFTDEALERHAGRFVWLSIDTERPENAAFVERYPVEAWPTLMVIDPSDGSVVVRWLGGMTVPQLVRLLDDAERALSGHSGGAAEAALAEADRLYGAGRVTEAIASWQRALELAPPKWTERPRVVESTLLAMLTADQAPRCVELARAELPGMASSPSRANAAAVGLFCALGLERADPARAPAIAELETAVQAELEQALGPHGTLNADDVSGLYDALVSAREDAGDEAGKRAVAQRWASYLEAQAAKAPNAEARAVFDSHRLSAYLALGEVARAVPMLEASEKALPGDYNPPARLAYALFKLGRFKDALAANDRALRLVYGPSKLRVLENRAEILEGMNDLAGAEKALRDAIAAWEALPQAQQREQVRQRLERALEALEARRGMKH